ncbi:MAG: hypothetical protein IKU19_08235, partial [Clostridia bacterium]|nr:hypothetical protein [Clostridia bacterium]
EVVFTYEAFGINGEANAVNSGLITVDVYANVVTEYARIFGFDVDLSFDTALEFVKAEGAMFNNFVVENYTGGMVKFTTDMGLTDGTKVFENGKYLVATLTFKVAGDFYGNDVVFGVGGECEYARDTALENELIVDFGTGTCIHVARLGDVNGDGKLTVEDSNAFYEWFVANPGAYNYLMDMDKDGSISYFDLALLRGAIVHNDAFLEY